MDKVFLVVQSDEESELLASVSKYIEQNYKSTITIISIIELLKEELQNGHYLLYLDDNEIKNFFLYALYKDITIGILPNDKAPISIKNYGVSKEIFEAVDDCFNEELISYIDLLKCNELIAFNRITVGDMHGMNSINFDEKSYVEKIKIFFQNLRDIKFKSYTITTSKDHKIETAASGITILEHTIVNEKSSISEYLSIHDGKLNAFILAPTSLLSYLWYLISIFIYQRISLISMPKSLGFIKSSSLNIVASKPMEYSIDGVHLSTKEINLSVLKDSINLHLGRSLEKYVSKSTKDQESKDTIQVSSMPTAEVGSVLARDKLPFFAKANDDAFRELFINLRESARLSNSFLILMVLSVLLATTGLFANSAPVIIGAMILAPLMSPIISLSMGVIRADSLMLQNSIKTLFYGIVVALLFSSLFTFLVPLDNITEEMQNRLSPNLLDLMVAVFSGIAGAYANSKEEIAKSLAGVAIAVALVPPLSVTGIGIGLMDFSVVYGSFLLFVTNLVGITLSAAITFIILGYSPLHKAKKGLVYTTVLMTFIAIPLVLSFVQIVTKNNYLNKIKTIDRIYIDKKEVQIKILKISLQDKQAIVEIETLSSRPLNYENIQEIKAILEKKIEKSIILEVIPKIILRH